MLRSTISFLLLFSMLSLPACRKKPHPMNPDPAFASYITAFTSGSISKLSRIRVRLSENHPEAVPGKEISDRLFDFTPGIKGHTEWVDEREIVFIPDAALPSGRSYEAEFRLEKLVKVPENLSVLPFHFSTFKQGLHMEMAGMDAYNDQDLSRQLLNMIAYTNDFAESDVVEQEVTAYQNGKPLPVQWKHSVDGRVHNLLIDSIVRGEERGELFIRWSGEELGFEGEGDHTVKIPPLGEFSVLHVKTTQRPSQSMTIYFSDPLQKEQDLEGLIHVQPRHTLKLLRQSSAITVYPEKRIRGKIKLHVSDGILNSLGHELHDIYTEELEFRNIQPAVELVGNGVILPAGDALHFPFRAVSLKAVQVKVIKIFEDNVAQFLQVNQLDGQDELKRAGRMVYKGEVPLISDEPLDYGAWNKFSLDLSKFISVEPGAIYRVQIGFKQSHALYPCQETREEADEEIEYPLPDPEVESFDEPGYYWYGDYEEFDYEEYDYAERDNPCSASYYMGSERSVARNVLASDLGIVAKAGSGTALIAAVTDLSTTEPQSGVQVDIYNFQNQLLGSQKTDGDGFVEIDLQRKPYLLIARKDKQRGYLRLDDGSSLSLSMFDVGGEETERGVKGFIYGERGVWRPGDSLYLNLILEDRGRALPEKHPVLFELLSPDNQVYLRRIVHPASGHFYKLHAVTDAEAPTGQWTARVKVGTSVFTRNVRIETVKPNRLKVALDFGTELLSSVVPARGALQVKWLHGADAPNLKADVELKLSKHKTAFKKFPAYVFDDPAKSFYGEERMIFEGRLDGSGKAVIDPKIVLDGDAPGMLLANFKVRAFEPGGEFSVDRLFVPWSPFRRYVGLRIPEGKGWNGALFSDEINQIPVVCVDEQGKGLTRTLKVEVYDVYWRWWWDVGESEDLSDVIENSSKYLLQSGTVNVVNGKGMYALTFKETQYGRKFIRIVDEEGGHSAGSTFYVTYKGWWNDAGAGSPGGAEMLSFSTDKEHYTVGERVEVRLPAASKGRTLVSIETGSKILKKFWVEASAGKFDFRATEEMSPNAYIHLTMIQPHKNTINDLPIRMYGVQPLEVSAAGAKLEPLIKMPDELRPEQRFTVQVSEANRRGMTYTLAVVDEGLLDLTRFKTPDPAEYFLAKEALSVRTWDMYKYVIGAQSKAMAGLLALGGDEYLGRQEGNQANRFKPVVRFLGPFYLKPGAVANHQINMPNYIGSVRTMVVASEPGAYGKTEKATPVRSPLMLLPTLPRVLGPGEELTMPVTVFAMDKQVRDVQIKVQTKGPLKLIGSSSAQMKFSRNGEQVLYFTLKAQDQLGKADILVSAVSGSEKASYPVELQIRAANPRISDQKQWRVMPGEKVSLEYVPVGIAGTNSAKLELSSLPPIFLEKRLEYLIQYPHGCLEQTISAAFPQLYVGQFLPLSDEQKERIQEHIEAALNKLKLYQLSDGGFSYWPGADESNAWSVNYAGHFLLEARSKGYVLPPAMLSKWLQHQRDAANTWTPSTQHGAELTQAYRLYTLALAGEPSLGAMNRLRGMNGLPTAALWRLAAAFQLSGKSHIAKDMVRSLNTDVGPYTEQGNTFGSRHRDRAMILETLSLLKMDDEASRVFTWVIRELGSEHWYSTQQTAYMLIGISRYLGTYKPGEPMEFSLSRNEAVKSYKAVGFLFSQTLKANGRESIRIENKGKNPIYIALQRSGIPGTDDRGRVRKNLELSITYTDLNGDPLQVESLKQGQDFFAELVLRNPGTLGYYENLSLTHIFPSGWEIRNARMDAAEDEVEIASGLDYQDIRDDRVLSYFDLSKERKLQFRIQLHAAYPGRFYAPSVYAEAMYDDQIRALEPGRWVQVTGSNDL